MLKLKRKKLSQDNDNNAKNIEPQSKDFKEDLNSNLDSDNGINEINDNDSTQNEQTQPIRKKKRGIIYLSSIPKYMNVTMAREIFGRYAEVGRVFLQPEKSTQATGGSKRKQKRRHFTEGWIEFESKRAAKSIAATLNNTPIATRKSSKFYDILWSMKYLPRFKWIHLTERLTYEQEVYKHKLQAEISQAKREASFFQDNLDKSEHLKKKNKKINKIKVI